MTHKQRCERLWALEGRRVLVFERSFQADNGRRIYQVNLAGTSYQVKAGQLDPFLDGVEATAALKLSA